MSKRPSTSNGVLSRLRHPAAGLHDLPIWSKLGLIMVVPTIATVVVGANGFVGHVQDAHQADRTRSLATLAESSGALVDGLQNERAAAVILLGATGPEKQGRLSAYRNMRRPVDDARGRYLQDGNSITDLPANFRKSLSDITRNLDDLSDVRSQVEDGKVELSSAKDWYQVLINNLLAVGDSSAQLAGDSDLSDQMRAAAAIGREKEFLSLQRTVVLNAFSLNELTPGLKRNFIAARTGQEQALQSFQSVASPSERELYDQRVSGSALREANDRAGDVEQLVGTNSSALPAFKVDDWDSAMVGQAKLLRDVQEQLNSRMANGATDLRDQVTRTLLLESGVLLALLLLGILFAWLVARSMARSLRDLRHGALTVAQHGLPQAVARLRDPALATSMPPEDVALQIAETLPVRSRDEFGQVTEAFNAVHLAAVRTAAEQAALRSSVATMFVNLARRSQILVDRLIGHLDRLERGEEDPDALAELFQLDHLATRMRRNDENLLVLAGADSTRVQREAASLLDVLRAAQSEVEHYTRIEFGVIDRDIEVASHAVNDLVHLLAELFDNATAFSPPDSHVVVEARRVGDQATLYVEDRGIGISSEQLAELNERLTMPPEVDVTVSRMMGLVVVARLAARHGVKVELRRAADRGTVADVALPASVLISRAVSGRGIEALPSQRAPLGASVTLDGGAGNYAFEGVGTFSGPMPPSRNLLGGSAAGKSLPAWSDLTGASGTVGVNGTGSSSHNGASATNGAGAGGPTFPPASPTRAVNGEPFGPPEPFVPRTPAGAGPGPLPHRQPGDPWSVDTPAGESGTGPTESGQEPISTDPRTGLPRRPVPAREPTPPVSAPPVTPFGATPPPAVPVVSAPPAAPVVSAPPAVAGGPPPAWPPIAPSEDETGATPPAVPEEFAAALDMTAELPKIRPQADSTLGVEVEVGSEAATGPEDRKTPVPAGAPYNPVAPPPVSAPPAGATPSPSPVAPAMKPDETMELPIFQELESAWFRSSRSAGASEGPPSTLAPSSAVPFQGPVSVPPAAPVPDPAPPARFEQVPGGNDPRSKSMYGTTAGSNSMVGTPMPGGGLSWHTSADEGWRAATAASDVPVSETTEAGLPKRIPMAQLVPGGIERPVNAAQRRTPEGVRGLLSAYHRGVQRGRSEPKDDDNGLDINPEPTTAGPQQQGGKEQEA